MGEHGKGAAQCGGRERREWMVFEACMKGFTSTGGGCLSCKRLFESWTSDEKET